MIPDKKEPLELPKPEEKLLRSTTTLEKYGWAKPVCILLALIATLIFSVYILQTNKSAPPTQPAPNKTIGACTQDVKQCPDGSLVGRSGPNCEFVCPNNPNNEEENRIKSWTTKNGLNKFGDPKNTMYAGGNPLFDERTGQAISYYEYMLQKFPDRPWNK